MKYKVFQGESKAPLQIDGFSFPDVRKETTKPLEEALREQP